MKKSPSDKCLQVRWLKEEEGEPGSAAHRVGVRLSFYFDREGGDSHHTIFLAGESRVQVADRLRELATLVMNGSW